MCIRFKYVIILAFFIDLFIHNFSIKSETHVDLNEL